MLHLNNKKEFELITCLQLSCGNCTYDDIRVFIAKRRNIENDIKEYSNLNQQLENAKDKTVQEGIKKSIDEIK